MHLGKLVNVSAGPGVERDGLQILRPERVGNYVHRSWHARLCLGSRRHRLFRPPGVGGLLGASSAWVPITHPAKSPYVVGASQASRWRNQKWV